jgi:hypothetical protein
MGAAALRPELDPCRLGERYPLVQITARESIPTAIVAIDHAHTLGVVEMKDISAHIALPPICPCAFASAGPSAPRRIIGKSPTLTGVCAGAPPCQEGRFSRFL